MAGVKDLNGRHARRRTAAADAAVDLLGEGVGCGNVREEVLEGGENRLLEKETRLYR